MKFRHQCYLTVAVALVASATMPGSATAFHALRSWHLPAAQETNNPVPHWGGANGFYGTGGPHDTGIQCAHCHIQSDGLVALDFDVSPPFGTMGNDASYTPGQTYVITASLVGEHKHAVDNSDQNGFAATFEDPGGNVMGGLVSDTPGNASDNCPSTSPQSPSGTTFVYGDCHGILSVDVTKRTQWTFSWIAPSAGSGDVTMWYGSVDGNTEGEESLNDDVVQGSKFLIEGP